jgi:hypothetical protein
VAGGGYLAGKHHAQAEAEQQQWQQQQPQQQWQDPPQSQPPPQSGGISPDDVSRLQELGKLHEQGILTDEEFAQQKAAILGTG